MAVLFCGALNLSPLIHRELLLAHRRRWFRPWRFLLPAAAAFAAIVLVFLSRDDDPRKLGRYLWHLLLVFGLGYIYISTMGLCSRFFTEERRHKTLGLLFLTRLRPGEIMLGKAAGVALPILYPLLGMLPLLLVTFLMGGISPALLAAAIATLVSLLALLLSLRLMTSIFSDDDSTAETVADAIFVALALGLPALSALNEFLTGAPLNPAWQVLSPAYAPWQLFAAKRETLIPEIYLTNQITALYTLLFLLLALARLKRAWRDEVQGPPARSASPISRFLDRCRARQRRRVRTLLDSSPYAWLLARDFRPALLSWGCLLLLLALWIIGLWHWTSFWLVPLNFWATCLLVTASIQVTTHYLAAREIAEARRNGGLELLLTSALSVDEILAGQERVIRAYARPLQLLLALLIPFFFLLGCVTRDWTLETFASYCGIWIIVAALGPWTALESSWSSFWLTLNTGRTGYAFRKGFWQQGTAFYLLFQLYIHRASVASFPTGSYAELILVWVFAAVVPLITFLTTLPKYKQKAAAHLRRIAQEPVPHAADPRLKNWDGQKPLFYDEDPEDKILV